MRLRPQYHNDRVNPARQLDSLIESSTVDEMTVVIANGKSKLTGSFYVNSPVTGNWEDFNVQDLVGYVDNHYRTLAKPEARGISGHSKGGFGALHIAMRQPDEFSSENLITGFVKFESGLATLPVEEAEMRVSNFSQDFTIS